MKSSMRGRGCEPRRPQKYLLEKSGEDAVLHSGQGHGWLKAVNDPGRRRHVPGDRMLSGKISKSSS